MKVASTRNGLLLFVAGIFLTIGCGDPQINHDKSQTERDICVRDDECGSFAMLGDSSATESISNFYFAATDSLFTSSSLYEYSFDSHSYKEILGGESGDLLIAPHSDSLVLFNRSRTNQNFRIIRSNAEDQFEIGSQKRLPSIVAGDPNGATYLDADTMFLSLHTQGSFALWQIDSETIQHVSGDFRYNGKQLRPTSVVRRVVGDTTFLFVAHQAYDFGVTGMEVSGGGSVFVFRYQNKTLDPIDADISKDGIQGISLQGSLPELLSDSEGPILSFSLCSRWVSNAKTCNSRIEAIDPTRLTSKMIWDLSDSKFTMNGPAVLDRSAHTIYFAAEKPENLIYNKYVVRANLRTRELSEIHKFPELSGGFHGLYFFAQYQELWITDALANGGSEIRRLSTVDYSSKGIVSLPLNPIGRAIIKRQSPH